jgi:glycosyltransferase involved in cell wall biosynthesis
MSRNGVTIGIPLYNEARYIEATIRSAAPQCEVALVSDNASTDGSSELCEALSREYPSVTFTRHPQNRGSAFNFHYVFEKASTPYFMWLGGHDVLSEGYVDNLVRLLEANLDAVLAYGATRYIDAAGEPIGKYEYAFAPSLADRSPAVRTLALIRHLFDCSLVHGVFRTEALRAALKANGSTPYVGADHVLLGRAALAGRFVYDSSTHFLRREMHSADTAAEALKRMKGGAPAAAEVSHRTMQREQYALAARASADGGLARSLFRLRARYHLVRRFGPFGEGLADRQLDRVLSQRLVRGSIDRLERLLEP